MSANTTLAKIRARAKALQRKNKNLKWIPAIKKASVELRKEKKIGVQSGSSNTAIDKKKKAKAPGKRKSVTGKTYYERRKNRSDKKGTLTGVSEAKMIGAIRARVEEKMGKAYVARDNAKLKRDKKTYQKVITECKVKLRKLK